MTHISPTTPARAASGDREGALHTGGPLFLGIDTHAPGNDAPIGMIGAGPMGANLVRRLAYGGHECAATHVHAAAVEEGVPVPVLCAPRWSSRARCEGALA